MKCIAPLIRAETYETYTNKKGGISYKAEFIERDQFDAGTGKGQFDPTKLAHKYRRITPVGCGQCIPCMLNYAADWATRIMLEKQYGYQWEKEKYLKEIKQELKPYPDGTCWFLTFTYEDTNLKTSKKLNTETGEILEGTTLYKKDMQDFWKRLRKHYPTMKIKYFQCGEYGNHGTLRPHYHAIVFGLPLDTTKFIKTGISQKFNTPRWKLEELTEIWGNGLVDIGRVTWNSAGYVARYSLKKATNKKNKDWYAAQGRDSEYVVMSNGIGESYFYENQNKIYWSDSVPITDRKGRIQKPPHSYDRLLKETNPRLYESIKRKREKVATTLELELRKQSDLTTEERRAISEARMAQTIKDMRREIT